MANIHRVGDSGSLGKAASRIAAAKTGAPNMISTASAYSGGIRVSRWAVADPGDVSLIGTQTLEHVASQLDAVVMAGPVVVAYRDASTQALRVASFNSNDVQAKGGGVIDDRRLAIVRESFGTSWFISSRARSRGSATPATRQAA